MMPMESLFVLKVLQCYLTNFFCQFNDEGLNEELGTILSLMNIYLWGDGKPADPVVWFDWKITIESLEETKMTLPERASSLKQEVLSKEQSFVVVFHFLNDYFWKNNNDIRKGEVIEAIEACMNDLENGRKNPLWEVWLKYFESELKANNEYPFWDRAR